MTTSVLVFKPRHPVFAPSICVKRLGSMENVFEMKFESVSGVKSSLVGKH